jgi:hypothetical protein
MALLAEHGAVVFKVVARDADFVGDFLPPTVDLPDLGLMAVIAFLVQTRLVLPVLEREIHGAHLQIDDFRPEVLGGFGKHIRTYSGYGK